MLDAQLLGVGPVQLRIRGRSRLVQLLDAPRHRAGVPVLEDAAGGQPERVLVVRHLGRRVVRTQPERRPLAVPLGLVEVHPLGLLDVGVVPGRVAVPGLLAVDHRPQQTTGLAQLLVGRQVLAGAEPEAAVLLEHRLVPVVLGPGEQVLHAHPLGDLDDLPGVLPRLAGRIDQLVPLLRASLGVAEHPFTLDPRRRGQYQVGDLRRRRGVDVADDDEPPVARLALEPVQVGHRDPGVGRLDPHRLDVAARQRAEHVHRVVAGLGRHRSRLEPPDLLGLLAVLGLHHQHVRRQAVATACPPRARCRRRWAGRSG